MHCKDFQELITAAVDRYLKKHEMDSFADHASKCPGCRYEYDSELSTKSLVQTRVRMVKTPPAVAESIARQLSLAESSSPLVEKRSWGQFLNAPFVKPAIAFAIVCAAVLVIVTESPRNPASTSTASVAGNDVILQSLSNYRAVVSGEIKPQLVSNEPENLKSFFKGKTEFPVLVPSMKECTLVGGVLNEHAGVTLAHVVYRHDNQIIYIYQACWDKVRKGEKLSLSDEAKNELQRTGWFTDSRPDGETIVLWTKGETLCAAVARMNKDDLIACLSSEETSGRDAW